MRYEVVMSDRFLRWLTPLFQIHWLRDKRAQARIAGRLKESVLKGAISGTTVLSEAGSANFASMSVRAIASTTLFCQQRVVMLLCGGDKASQQRDIRLARQMAREV